MNWFKIFGVFYALTMLWVIANIAIKSFNNEETEKIYDVFSVLYLIGLIWWIVGAL
jgi:hypothetical protein